jgi:exodeoxyribonuclease VII large subunit
MQLLRELKSTRAEMGRLLSLSVQTGKKDLNMQRQTLTDITKRLLNRHRESINSSKKMLELLNPQNILKRGYAVVMSSEQVVRSPKQVVQGASLEIILADGSIKAEVRGSI